MQNKVVVKGKVEKDKNNNKKFKISQTKSSRNLTWTLNYWAMAITKWKN